MKTAKHVLPFLLSLLICQLTFGQNHVGYYKNLENIAGLGFVTQIHLTADSTFEYYFAGDLFHDKAIGEYSIDGNLIRLNYTTVDYHVLQIDDSVEQRTPNISTFVRPIELEIKRKKLIVLKRKNSKNEIEGKEMILKKVKEKNWNNSGSTSTRLITN